MSPLPELPADLHRRIRDCGEIVVPPLGFLGRSNQSLPGIVFLVALARALAAREIFEIGTHNGATAWTIARNVPGAVVHTLDIPIDAEPALSFSDTDRASRTPGGARAYDMLSGPAEVVQHVGDSARFDFGDFRGRCDLVYIDGAHTPDYVRSDTRNALSILSDRGAIVWDDYWRRVGGVREVLDASDLPLYRVQDTRLVLYLRPAARAALTAEAA